MNNELFEFKKLDELVNEIAGLYPRLNDKYTLNKSDAINWGVYVLRQLGAGASEPQIYNYEISNHMVKLDTEIRIIDGVYRSKCNTSPNTSINFSNLQLPVRYVQGIKSNIISDSCAKLAPYNIGYTFSLNYPFCIFNFTDQCVSILAQSLVIDPNTKIPMYPDEESTKQCIQEYILSQWLKEPAILGEYDWNNWLLHDQKYKDYFSQAKGFYITPSQEEGANIMTSTNYRYSPFRIQRRRY